MAKIYGLFGAMTGKLADTVMSVRNGEQLARKYQPIVFNPSTPAQIAQRAKLKFLSQLSAVMAPVIAMRRLGPVSSRNIFTKKNFPSVSYSDNTASMTLVNIDLTGGITALPAVTATREGGNVTVELASGAANIVDRVVYAVFSKEADDKLRLKESFVVSEPGTGSKFSGTFYGGTAPLLILAYGVRDNNENARAIFGNLEAPTAETVAKLVVTSTLTESDITLTETQGIELAAS